MEQVPPPSRRRALYGLNVVLGVTLALALAVLVNWAVDFAYWHASSSVRGWLRLNIAGGRSADLSPQTRNRLATLEGEHRLVTLLPPDDPRLLAMRDLADEYAQHALQIRVTHLDPDRDAAAVRTLKEEVREQYAADLAPLTDAIEASRDALDDLAEQLDHAATDIEVQLRDATWDDPGLRVFLEGVRGPMRDRVSELRVLRQSLDERLAGPLPAVSEARLVLAEALQRADRGFVVTLLGYLRDRVRVRDTPPEVRELLLRMIRKLDTVRQGLEAASGKLGAAQPPQRYESARVALESPPAEGKPAGAVVLFTPDGARTLAAGELFEAVRTPGTAEPELRFIGEERLTGTLIALSLRERPLVVLVRTRPGNPSDARQRFAYITSRLRAAEMEVVEWSPAGGGGERSTVAPPPDPERGRRTVWIVLGGDDENSGGTPPPSHAAIATVLRTRLQAGDGVLLMLGFDPAASYGQPDPLRDLARSWGITPLADRVVMWEAKTAEREPQPRTAFEVTRYPHATPMGEAADGRPGVVLRAIPLDIHTPPPPDGTTTLPLVRVQEPRMWLEAKPGLGATYDQAATVHSAVVAAAAWRHPQGVAAPVQLVVLGDPAFASDALAAAGVNTGEGGAPTYPANAELVLNSVYWLARLEEMIAITPRGGDLPRVRAMSEGELLAWQAALLVGLPLVILAAGVGVWWARRRE